MRKLQICGRILWCLETKQWTQWVSCFGLSWNVTPIFIEKYGPFPRFSNTRKKGFLPSVHALYSGHLFSPAARRLPCKYLWHLQLHVIATSWAKWGDWIHRQRLSSDLEGFYSWTRQGWRSKSKWSAVIWVRWFGWINSRNGPKVLLKKWPAGCKVTLIAESRCELSRAGLTIWLSVAFQLTLQQPMVYDGLCMICMVYTVPFSDI